MTWLYWLQVLHQESKERLWLTRERKVSFCHPRKEQSGLKSPWQSGDTHQGSPSITDRGIAPHTSSWKCCGSLLRKVPMRWTHCPELKWKLNSKSCWWGQAAGVDCAASSWRGSSGIFFSFFLRVVLVSWGSAGSLCAVHSVFFGSAWYVLFTLVWWIQGTIPATLTAVGVVRIT